MTESPSTSQPCMHPKKMDRDQDQEEKGVEAEAQWNDEHTTVLSPTQWYAKWQEDKEKWLVERARWQEEHTHYRSVRSPQPPTPCRNPTIPQSPIGADGKEPSPPEAEAQPGAGWGRYFGRAPWNTIKSLMANSHSNIHTENDIPHVLIPPSRSTKDK
ncbi:hypothetical protein C8R44DRAFT_730908 [Mycena epipterygia]|nr:hypothetical protein C8R44DRAFT_730908 [Mycena epipterygia]